jgi:predicted nuclease of predicted toxin-antitoxin system
MTFLIDECLHTSLVQVAHEAGFAAFHVSHTGLSGLKDWQICEKAIHYEHTFVTNDRFDFLALYRSEPLHAGLVILVPNVVPAQQRLLFQAALVHIGRREIVNAVLEVELRGAKIYCSEYVFPPEA